MQILIQNYLEVTLEIMKNAWKLGGKRGEILEFCQSDKWEPHLGTLKWSQSRGCWTEIILCERGKNLTPNIMSSFIQILDKFNL